MKKWCAGPCGELVGGIDISDRGALIPAGDHCVVETVHLEPAVVAAAVVLAAEITPRVPIRTHHYGGGVDVAELGELRVALHAAGGVHLDGLLSGDPPEDVEVVHRAVAEDAPEPSMYSIGGGAGSIVVLRTV